MNYQQFADYNNKPAYYKRTNETYYDEGQGIPQLTSNNMTVKDLFLTPFLFLQEHRQDFNGMAETALRGVQTNSELSKLFLSDRNIQRIQKLIKKEVFKRTNGKFRLDIDQEQRDVFIAMRAVYMEHARFLPGEIVRQVKRLNKKVVSEILPGIITEIRQHHGYLQEINKPLEPIPLPINVNNAGRRTLPSVTRALGME